MVPSGDACPKTFRRDRQSVIISANCPKRKGARTLLVSVLAIPPELFKLWVDGGFNGPEFAAWVQTQHPKLMVEVVARPPGCPVSTCTTRWVIERTFGWLMHCRRLVRDDE